MPSKYSSGQACRSSLVTLRARVPDCVSPGWYPTTMRAGMPSSRAMTAMVEAKWMQYPAFTCRNLAMTPSPSPS